MPEKDIAFFFIIKVSMEYIKNHHFLDNQAYLHNNFGLQHSFRNAVCSKCFKQQQGMEFCLGRRNVAKQSKSICSCDWHQGLCVSQALSYHLGSDYDQ